MVISALTGLAAPNDITQSYADLDPTTIVKGDFVELVDADPSKNTFGKHLLITLEVPQLRIVVSGFKWLGVARTIPSELGQNSSIRINGGESIFSTSTNFTSSEHGYEGISFDISRVSIGATANFSVSKDLSTAKGAIDKFVEEFNDAQDYIASLTQVNQTGDDVSSSRFTEIRKLTALPQS